MLFLLLIYPAAAWAYIDPGTGATFVGTLAPIIMAVIAAAGAVIVKYFWDPLRAIFSKLFGKKPQENKEA